MTNTPGKGKNDSINMKQFSLKQNFSIPNLISILRLLMIPLILWLYFTGRVWPAVIMVVISGITDAVDGYIARHFNQITTLGKVLDPLADKLTQIAICIALVIQFPAVIPLVVVLIVKELLMLVWGVRLLRTGAGPFSAMWWGKVATIAFYAGIIIIMAFSRQLKVVGVTIICVAITLIMLYSMLRYWQVFKQKIAAAEAGQNVAVK